MELVLAALIFTATTAILETRTPFAFKKTPVIILMAIAFTAAYSATAFLLSSAGYALISIISFVAGISILLRRMFHDAMRF